MDTFLWDEHFTTGIGQVDEQHRRLVQLINQLGESLIAGGSQDPDALQAAFDQLADYVRLHFSQEEAMMAREGMSAGYLALHHQYHTEFAQQLAHMWAARDATPNPAEVLHGFLRAWLAMHILGEDQSMARQIAAIQAGTPAEQAHARETSNRDNATAALLLAIQGLYKVLAQQNTELMHANQQLEARVLERTLALAQANQRLQALSNSDGLLGIANRRHFDALLDTEWRRAARERRPLSLLMIDVDHFKRYNDHYGHPAGDRCLQAVARAAGSPAAARRPADLVLGLASHWLHLGLGVALWGVHMGITQGLLAAMVADTAPPDLRGTAYGFFNLLSGLTMLVASITAGVLWHAFGSQVTFFAGAGFAALTLLGLALWPPAPAG